MVFVAKLLNVKFTVMIESQKQKFYRYEFYTEDNIIYFYIKKLNTLEISLRLSRSTYSDASLNCL